MSWGETSYAAPAGPDASELLDLDGLLRHVTETGKQLLSRSTAIAEAVREGRLAIAGLTYQLADGKVVLRDHIGDIGES